MGFEEEESSEEVENKEESRSEPGVNNDYIDAEPIEEKKVLGVRNVVQG